jgi:hypothetical protein
MTTLRLRIATGAPLGPSIGVGSHPPCAQFLSLSFFHPVTSGRIPANPVGIKGYSPKVALRYVTVP